MSLAKFAGGRAASRQRHRAEAQQDTCKKLADEQAERERQSHEAYLVSLEALDPLDYLQRLSYNPEVCNLLLAVVLDGHSEEHKCTWYNFQCTLGSRGQDGYMSWRCKKRLCDLREHLHDPVKKALGPVYTRRFEETPFAKYGGLPGTTSRLADWFRTLSGIINHGLAEVPLTVLVFRFLGTPVPHVAHFPHTGGTPDSNMSI
mmetsp:Transcript_90543/g.141970  ORF Transcript_90543/g.141970 Transcript_90543/m.141970 type:complete len:203 (+) Transcript_90543:45-653(+)